MKTTDDHGAPVRLAIAFVLILALVWLVVGIASAAEPESGGGRPNVLLILCDDCGYGDVTPALTPSLSAMANDSARFTDAYANSLCSPTRAALYTGRYAERSRIYTALGKHSAEGLPLSEVTLAEQLRAVGYHTGLVGKWHLGHNGAAARPWDQGYAEFFGGLAGAVEPFSHRRYEGPGPLGPLDWWRNATPLPTDNRYSVTAETQEAIGFIQRNAGQPWFLTLAYHAVHVPRRGPNGQTDYNGMLRAMDTGIGQVLAALDDTGQAGNTLVWFLSDNGGDPNNRNAGLKGAKGSLWEGGIRVQTYVRWPGRIPAGDRRGSEHAIDMMPTVLDILGVPAVHALDGVSLKGSLLGNTGTPYRRLFWSQGAGGNPPVAMRDNQWKLVRYPGQAPYLFNLAADRAERHNVAGANGARVTTMTQMINAWRTEVGR